MALMKIYDLKKRLHLIGVRSQLNAVFLVGLLCLSGCASQTRKAVQSLDQGQAAYVNPVCESARRLAPMHDDIKLTRSLASPGVLLMGGAPVLLPMLAINMGLDTWDRLDASSVNQSCGGHRTPMLNVLEDVVLGAGFDLFTGRFGLGR